MKKPKVGLIVCICALLFLVTSFLFSGGQRGTTDDSEKEKINLTLWSVGKGGEQENYLQRLVEIFMEQHPNIHVEAQLMPDTIRDIDTKLNAGVLSKTFPDVFFGYEAHVAARGVKGDWAPIEHYMKGWEGLDDIFPTLLKKGHYKGVRQGLCYWPDGHIRFYRKDFFEEDGFDPEKPPRDWDELKEFANKLVKKDSEGNIVRAGFDVPASQPNGILLEMFMRMGGSVVYDEKTEEAHFNDEGGVLGMTFLSDLYKTVSIPYHWNKIEEIPFINKKSAMAYFHNILYSDIIRREPSMKPLIGVAPALARNGKKDAICGNRTAFISSYTKYPDECWELIKLNMSKEEVWERYVELNVPVIRKSLHEQMVQNDPEYAPFLVEMAQVGRAKYSIWYGSIANKWLCVKAWEEVINNVKTPKQALDDAMAGLQAELKTISK